MDSVADGDNVARPTHIQVWSREGDEAWVSHSMLVPTQHDTQAEGYVTRLTTLVFSWQKIVFMTIY